MVLYIKNPKDSTQTLLELINKFSKVSGYKINIKNQLHFYTLTINYMKKEKIPFKIGSGTSLVVQRLRLCASNAGSMGSIPSQGTMIPHTVWCGQKIF